MAAYKRHTDPPVDVIIDLETLGKSFYSPIVQIGYTTLDQSQGDQINVKWDIPSLGPFRIDQGTVAWWLKRKTPAKAGVFGSGHPRLADIHTLMGKHAGSHAMAIREPDMADALAGLWADEAMEFLDIRQAFQKFVGWLRGLGNNVHIWTHVGFDYGLMKYTMEALKMEAPWGYYHVHDLRTCNALAGKMDPPREGEYHTALADARHEAGILQTQMAILGISHANQLHMDWKGIKSPYTDQESDEAIGLLQKATRVARLVLGQKPDGELDHQAALVKALDAVVAHLGKLYPPPPTKHTEESHGGTSEEQPATAE